MLETRRLLLRPFQCSDAQYVYDYRKEPLVNCFKCMKLNSLEKARADIQKREDNPYCFAIVLKEIGKVIGEIEVHPESSLPDFANGPKDTYSPCWMLHKDYQGKGYAYEAAIAVYDWLFFTMDARRIYAYTEDYNLACQRLCEKLGMRREGLFVEFVSFVNNPDGTPHYENTFQYAILKSEWLNRKKVKITAIRKACYPDLMEKYENPIEHACDVQEGQIWISENGQKPQNFCDSAWESISAFVAELAKGGGNFYDGWMKNPHSAMLSCNDGFRPVSFLIETIEK